MPIFTDVLYFVSPSLPEERRLEVSELLLANGGTASALTEATHIITNTNRFEGWQAVREGVAIVTEKWVERSMVLGKMQPPQYYSADPQMFFSGVVACASDLPTSDLEVLSAGITTLGGQFRMGLTRDVTHLFALSPSGLKYQTAMHYREHTNVTVLLPHWFDDVVRLGYSALETAPYEWPNLRILESGVNTNSVEERDRSKDKARKELLKSLHSSTDAEMAGTLKNVWSGRKVMLGKSLKLAQGRREAVEAGIKRAGGAIVQNNVEEADVLVTRYRHGKVYLKALELGKIIGTLAWLYHVQSTGAIVSPTDQLLHYPNHKRPIEGFSSHIISLTNYTGESRDYLKKLIIAMGAEFTPSMSGKNTVLVAAYLSGTKSTKARSWSIPIVNHTWLEDCFLQWKNLTVALEKYVVFPPGLDFSTVLGIKGVTGVERDLEDEDLAEDDGDDDDSQAEDFVHTQEASVGGVADEGLASQRLTPNVGAARGNVPEAIGAENSVKDIREVAELIGTGHPHDQGEETARNIVSPSRGRGRKPVSSTKGRVTTTNVATPPQKGAAPRTLAGRGLRRRDSVHIESEDEAPADEAQQRTPDASTSKSKTTPKPEKATIDKEDLSDGDPHRLGLPKQTADPQRSDPITRLAARMKSQLKAATKAVRRTAVNAGASTSPSEDETPVQKQKGSKPQLKAVDFSTDPDTGDDTDLPSDPRVLEKAKEKVKGTRGSTTTRAPKRVMSVVIVSPAKSHTDRKGKDLPRTDSVRATAQEAGDGSPRRPQPRLLQPGGQDEASSSRPHLRRSAASKATQKLRDDVMPDVLNFEKEMRRTRGKGRAKADDESSVRSRKRGERSDAEGEGVREREPTSKRRRVSKGGAKSSGADTEDESESSQTPPHRRGRPRVRREEESGSESDDSQKKGTTHRSVGAGTGRPKHIRLMTTGYTLSDDAAKALVSLGVKMTSKPSDCTHLIVPKLLRTQKFLCALAVAPYILSDKWAIDSAARKEIQPEEKYALVDRENEKKYGFQLLETLSRAKQNKGRLLAKNIFYVTPKVPVDMTLFRSVVIAFGGQLSTQNVTDRVLKNNKDRHIISCPEDRRLWRSLAEEHPIYTQELILTGVLRQRIDWDDPAFRVSGSLDQ